MSFNYHKQRDHGNSESFWTSYSDLFLGLSTIFLLLYVVASLRTSTDGIKSQIENQRLSMQVQDLKNQLKMYEGIKQDYLKNEASKGEMQEYNELMDKLTLLQEEAKDEKERLRQQAMQNESKENALNKYQQMVRNIINANKMAKTKIASREDIIQEQDVEIDVKEQKLADLDTQVRQKEKLISDGERKIEEANKALDRQMAELKKALKQKQISAKAYEKKLASAKAQAEERLDLLRDANEQAQNQLNTLNTQLSSAKGQLEATQGELSSAKGKLTAAQGALSSAKGQLAQTEGELSSTRGMLAQKQGEAAALQGKVAGLSGELAKAKSEMDARKQIAREIKKGFAANGIKAEIDMQTGDVLIDFGDHYFELDSANLKPEMKDILEKAIPVYSKSLFGNDKVAKQISSVEVIGFASPIYRGKFVDPNSSKAGDREALKYNMDLSYRRAKSIFNYIIDEKTMAFDHQRDLLPLMKVSGRSFLEIFKSDRKAASAQDFCKVNDCKKAQRVIIRFSMDGKK